MLEERIPTFADTLVAQLSADILSGRLAPGTKLRLHGLCKTYDVGMSPLREALSRLTGLGFVVWENQRGFRVAPASLEDLRDITQTRCRLEVMAMQMAIERGTSEWEATVLASHHRLSRHPRTRDHLIDETWEKLHRTFHLALLEACGSPRHLSFCRALLDHFDRYRRVAVQMAGHHPTLKSIHADLVAAVLDKDVDRATALLVEHIEDSGAAIAKLAGPKGFSSLERAM